MTRSMAMRAPRPLRAAVDALEGAEQIDGLGTVLARPADALASGRLAPALEGRWLGHALHPVLTDVPLGCWIGAELLDVLGGRASRRGAQRLVGLGLLAVPLTVASGLVDWSGVDDPRARRVGVAHAVGNGAAAGLYAVSWLARRRGRHVVGVMTALAGGVVAVGTGYLGGHLSFARGVGVGERGLHDRLGAPEEPQTTGSADAELVDAPAAMAVLGVEREQLDAMVADDLLVVRVVRDDVPFFAPSDLMAVRMVGG